MHKPRITALALTTTLFVSGCATQQGVVATRLSEQANRWNELGDEQ